MYFETDPKINCDKIVDQIEKRRWLYEKDNIIEDEKQNPVVQDQGQLTGKLGGLALVE